MSIGFPTLTPTVHLDSSLAWPCPQSSTYSRSTPFPLGCAQDALDKKNPAIAVRTKLNRFIGRLPRSFLRNSFEAARERQLEGRHSQGTLWIFICPALRDIPHWPRRNRQQHVRAIPFPRPRSSSPQDPEWTSRICYPLEVCSRAAPVRP